MAAYMSAPDSWANINHIIEMSLQTFEFAIYIIAHGCRDIYMMAGQVNLHVRLLFIAGITMLDVYVR